MFNASNEDNDQYVSVGSLCSYFGIMSVSEVAMQRSIDALLQAGLIEPYDLSKNGYSDDQRVAISQSGICHVEMGLLNPIYFEQMAVTTRIPDTEVAAIIRDAYKSTKALDARLEDVRAKFCTYLIDEDAKHCNVPATPQYRRQSEMTIELGERWKSSAASTSEMLHVPEIAAERVRGSVEKFDHSRGFGFISIPSLKDTAFLHASTLERDGFDELYDGDDLVCDVSRNLKGLIVSHVREVSRSEGPILSAFVIKLFEERGYGFVHVPELGVDAFFHFQLLSASERADLYEGIKLAVDVITDKQGRSQVRRIIDIPRCAQSDIILSGKTG